MDGDNTQYNASNQRYGNGQNAVNNHKNVLYVNVIEQTIFTRIQIKIDLQ